MYNDECPAVLVLYADGDCDICENNIGDGGCAGNLSIITDSDNEIIACPFEPIPRCGFCGSRIDVSYNHSLAEFLCYDCQSFVKRK